MVWLVLTAQAVAPPGWLVLGRKTVGYAVRLEPGAGHDGGVCVRVEGWKPGPDSFVNVSQFVDASPWAGRRLRLRGWLRAEAIDGWAGLYMRVDDRDRQPLAFDNMDRRPIRGTVGWRRYEVVLDIPEDAAALAFGMLLSGRGTAYLDDLSLDTVGADVPVTRPSIAEIRRLRASQERSVEDAETATPPDRSARPREPPQGGAEEPESPDRSAEEPEAADRLTAEPEEPESPDRSAAEPAPPDSAPPSPQDSREMKGDSAQRQPPSPRDIPRDSPGWVYAVAAEIGGYEVATEPNDEVLGVSVAVRSRVERPSRFLDFTRWVDGRKLRGRRVRLSARIRSAELEGWAGLWMRVDGVNWGDVLSFESMQNSRPVVGTRDWRRYELVHDISEEAEYVFFGLIVDGPGKVWMKDVELSVVPDDVPLTAPPRIKPKPENLDFEAERQAATRAPFGLPGRSQGRSLRAQQPERRVGADPPVGELSGGRP